MRRKKGETVDATALIRANSEQIQNTSSCDIPVSSSRIHPIVSSASWPQPPHHDMKRILRGGVGSPHPLV